MSVLIHPIMSQKQHLVRLLETQTGLYAQQENTYSRLVHENGENPRMRAAAKPRLHVIDPYNGGDNAA
jgi:hypothetical protein